MSANLIVTKTLNVNRWVITATFSGPSILPAAIFTYENTGLAVLGTYFGVVNVLDLPRLNIYTGTAIPIFANKYVLYPTATIVVDPDGDPDQVSTTLVENVKIFSIQYQEIQSSSKSYIIP